LWPKSSTRGPIGKVTGRNPTDGEDNGEDNMHKLHSKLTATTAICASSMAIAIAAPAYAQTAAPPPPVAADQNVGLGDIIVTAEKRSTSLQRTPIAVTALTAQALEKAQVRSLNDIQALVPSFQIGQNDGYAQITIRGIGISSFVAASEGSVAVNQNEVYVSRPIAQLTGLYDVSSIEVLRGPQGTLYGRNATAGSVNISTTRPTNELSGYGRVSVGNYRAINAEGAVGGPIVKDLLLVRVAAMVDKHSGYGKNLVTGSDIDNKDAWAVRGTLMFTPTSSFTATVIADYYKESDNGAAVHYFGAAGLLPEAGAIGAPPTFVQLGGFAPTDIRDVATVRDPKLRVRTSSVTGILEWNHGPIKLKSVTGYRDQNTLTFTPLGAGSKVDAFYIAGEPAHQFSEELQANYSSHRFNATLGAYYFKETDSSIPGSSPFDGNVLDLFLGLPPRNPDYLVDVVEIGGTIKTTAKALFGQMTYEIADGLSLIAGLRYSEETKSAILLNRGFDPFAPYISNSPYTNDSPMPTPTYEPKVKFTATTPKLGIQYQVNPRSLLYATYSKGFKSGGYDVTTVAPAFQPERLTAYEAGFKTTILDNRLRLNGAIYYYDYTNLQVSQTINTIVVTANAATARNYGAELEASALVSENFTIDASASYTHARYRKYTGPDSARPLLAIADFSGNSLDNAPDFHGRLGGEYTWPLTAGKLSFRADADYSTRYYFTPGNQTLVSQAPFARANAYLTYRADANWHVTAYVKNISDYIVKTSAAVLTPVLFSPVSGGVGAPRTFGVEFGYKF
jgi:iron complex outermembrane recepter protein